MEKFYEQIKARWHRVDGIIHAAGLVQDHLILDRPKDHGAEVMRVKVDGARILADLTENDPPDFMVFCSSMVALSGVPGQSDYSAANAALDEMAGARVVVIDARAVSGYRFP